MINKLATNSVNKGNIPKCLLCHLQQIWKTECLQFWNILCWRTRTHLISRNINLFHVDIASHPKVGNLTSLVFTNQYIPSCQVSVNNLKSENKTEIFNFTMVPVIEVQCSSRRVRKMLNWTGIRTSPATPMTKATYAKTRFNWQVLYFNVVSKLVIAFIFSYERENVPSYCLTRSGNYLSNVKTCKEKNWVTKLALKSKQYLFLAIL